MEYKTQKIAHNVTLSYQMLRSSCWSSFFLFRTFCVEVSAQSLTIVAEILLSFLNPPGIFSSYYFQLNQDRLLSHYLQIHNPLINLWLNPLYFVLLAVSVSSAQISKHNAWYVPYSVQTNALSFYGYNFIVLWSSIYGDYSSGHVQSSKNKNTNIIN
jgi:hypothetical protein